MRFSKYFNHESGNRNIYTQNNLLHMTLDELLEKELELAYQYNTIGIPLDEELLSSSYAHQYMDEKGLPRWRAGEEMSNVSKQKMMEGFGDDATAEQMPEVYQSEINPKEQTQIQPAAAQTQGDINWGQVAQLAGEGLKFGIDKIKQRRSEAQIPSMQPQTNQNPIPADIASQDSKQLLPQGDVPAQENPQIQTTQKPKNPWGERLLKMAAVAADGIANPKSEAENWNQVAQSLGKGIRFGIDKYKQKRSKVEGVATGTEPVIGQEALEKSEDFVEERENKPDFTLLPRLTEREPEYSWGDKRYVNSLQGRQTNETESEYVKRVIEEGFERERPIVKEEPYLTYEELYGEPEGTPTGAAADLQGYLTNDINAEIDMREDLSAEEKERLKIEVARIKDFSQSREKEIEKEHLKKQAKNYGGAALSIGSAGIPSFGGSKVTGMLSKLLYPVFKNLNIFLGKNFAEQVQKSIVEGVVSGAVSGLGDSMLNERELLESVGKNALKNVVQNSILKTGNEAIKRYSIAKELNKNVDNWNIRQQRKQQENALQYYNSYVKGKISSATFEEWLKARMRRHNKF